MPATFLPIAQEAEGLARELFEARRELRNAGCALHDQAAPCFPPPDSGFSFCAWIFRKPAKPSIRC